VAGASGAGLAAASHAAWALLAACGLAVAVVGYASTGRRALATADRAREILAGDAPGPAAKGTGRGTAADGGTQGGARTDRDAGTDGDAGTVKEAQARGTAMGGR
jgi:hypothetical protein